MVTAVMKLKDASLSAIKMMSSAYLRLLIFLPAILIPACASSSPAFLMMKRLFSSSSLSAIRVVSSAYLRLLILLLAILIPACASSSLAFHMMYSAAAAAAAAAKSLQSCLTLCDPIDGSPPGSPIPGIIQPRLLEWVAISSSNA